VVSGDAYNRPVASIFRPPSDESVIEAAPECKSCRGHIRNWVLLATILGSSIAFIDQSITTLALPALQHDLKATVLDAQWVIEAYALFLASLILVGGSLGDRLGRRRMFMAGIVLFASSSLACGLAQNVAMLIASRAVQGIGGALVTPGSLAIISATFSGADRGRAIGTWSGFTAVTSVIGPVLGGFLIQHFTWRSAFFINLPICAFVLWVTWRRVPESRNESAAGRIDWLGAAVCTLGLGGLVFGLIQSQSDGFASPLVRGALTGGILGIACFILVESRVAAPMVPLHLFRSPVFAGTNLLTLFLYGAVLSLFFFLPLNLIEVQGYSTAAAGAAMLPSILIMSLLARWTGALSVRLGPRLPMVIGPTLAACGLALFARTGVGTSYWTGFLPAATVFGIGMVITVPPLTTTVMGAVSGSHAGLASGINNAVARTGGLIAVAVFGVIFVGRFEASLHDRLASQSLPGGVRQAVLAQQSRLAAEMLPPDWSRPVRTLVQSDLNAAFVDAFRICVLVGAGLALTGALIAFFMVRTRMDGAAAMGAVSDDAGSDLPTG
jgi:EmrB/QacA subfamily drug resistance transporter